MQLVRCGSLLLHVVTAPQCRQRSQFVPSCLKHRAASSCERAPTTAGQASALFLPTSLHLGAGREWATEKKGTKGKVTEHRVNAWLAGTACVPASPGQQSQGAKGDTMHQHKNVQAHKAPNNKGLGATKKPANPKYTPLTLVAGTQLFAFGGSSDVHRG
jgi:hypothetical protein